MTTEKEPELKVKKTTSRKLLEGGDQARYYQLDN